MLLGVLTNTFKGLDGQTAAAESMSVEGAENGFKDTFNGLLESAEAASNDGGLIDSQESALLSEVTAQLPVDPLNASGSDLLLVPHISLLPVTNEISPDIPDALSVEGLIIDGVDEVVEGIDNVSLRDALLASGIQGQNVSRDEASSQSFLQQIASARASLSREPTAPQIAAWPQAAVDARSASDLDGVAFPALDLASAIDSIGGEEVDSRSFAVNASELRVPSSDMVDAVIAEVADEVSESVVITNTIKGVEAASAAQRPAAASLAFNQAFGQPGWDNEVTEKVLWMAAQNLQMAEIRLDPPELGSLQVRVSVQNDQTQVAFVSPHPAVREALDSQATRLREMLAEQGLNLVDVNVSSQERQNARQETGSDDTQRAEAELELEDVQVGETSIEKIRLVDHYV